MCAALDVAACCLVAIRSYRSHFPSHSWAGILTARGVALNKAASYTEVDQCPPAQMEKLFGFCGKVRRVRIEGKDDNYAIVEYSKEEVRRRWTTAPGPTRPHPIKPNPINNEGLAQCFVRTHRLEIGVWRGVARSACLFGRAQLRIGRVWTGPSPKRPTPDARLAAAAAA